MSVWCQDTADSDSTVDSGSQDSGTCDFALCGLYGAIKHNAYGVRPFSAYSFQDHLGRVRGTKSKIEDGYATGTLPLRGVAVGDLAGAQPLRVQLVLEFRKISLPSAAPFHHVVGPSATLALPHAELHWGWATEESCSEP